MRTCRQSVRTGRCSVRSVIPPRTTLKRSASESRLGGDSTVRDLAEFTEGKQCGGGAASSKVSVVARPPLMHTRQFTWLPGLRLFGQSRGVPLFSSNVWLQFHFNQYLPRKVQQVGAHAHDKSKEALLQLQGISEDSQLVAYATQLVPSFTISREVCELKGIDFDSIQPLPSYVAMCACDKDASSAETLILAYRQDMNNLKVSTGDLAHPP